MQRDYSRRLSNTGLMTRPETPLRARPAARRAAAISLTLALVAGFLSASVFAPDVSPASATMTVLCTGYDQCTKKGRSNFGYEAASDNLYWRMVGGHNCTNYVAYRLTTAGLANVRPWIGDGNAKAWGTLNDDLTDKTPVKGAVAWWAAGKDGAGSSGHVAYVEKVVSSTEIIVSEDNYGGNFYWKRITKSGGRWPTGFVHLKDSRTPALADYSATQVGQSVWTDSSKKTAVTSTAMRAGSSAWVELTYRNTGRKSWQSVALGTQGAPNRVSELAAGWKSTSRAAVQAESSVAPGKIATFGFRITIPADATAGERWFEHFAPIKGATWMLQSDAWVAFASDDRADLTAAPRPVISGTAKQNAKLTAKAGAWAPTGVVLSYQWKRNGVNISKATTASYTLDDKDVGTRITVAVSGKLTGYLPSLQTSASTAIVASEKSDRLKVGERLKSGYQIVSKNGKYEFIQMKDGDARIYNRLTDVPLWSNAVTGKYLRTWVSGTGKLVTATAASKVRWASHNTGSKKATKAVLRNDGVLVLYTKGGKKIWSSKTSGR